MVSGRPTTTTGEVTPPGVLRLGTPVPDGPPTGQGQTDRRGQDGGGRVSVVSSTPFAGFPSGVGSVGPSSLRVDGRLRTSRGVSPGSRHPGVVTGVYTRPDKGPKGPCPPRRHISVVVGVSGSTFPYGTPDRGLPVTSPSVTPSSAAGTRGVGSPSTILPRRGVTPGRVRGPTIPSRDFVDGRLDSTADRD